MKVKTTTQIKHALKKQLLKDCKERDFQRHAQLINYFYECYVDIDKFETLQDYLDMLMRDRYSNEIFDDKKAVNFLVNERLDLVHDEVIKRLGA